MRAAFLGPPGTNSHDALLASGADVEPVSLATVPAVVAAVQDGETELGIVPLENSREGAVGATLDALVFDAEAEVRWLDHCEARLRRAAAEREDVRPGAAAPTAEGATR